MTSRGFSKIISFNQTKKKKISIQKKITKNNRAITSYTGKKLKGASR